MLQAEGFNIQPVSKSVNGKSMSTQPYINAGIDYLKDFEKIIVHPRCKNIIDEFKMYSYKVDKNTGEILPLIVDAHNHCLTGDSLVRTKEGNIYIKDLVGKEGELFCYNEDKQEVTLSNYKDVRMTSKNESVMELELESGEKIRATPDHLFYTSNGWKRLIEIDVDRDRILDI